MTTSTMMTQAGVGMTAEPNYDLVVFTLTNAHGGLVPIPMTIEECEELAALLNLQAAEAREAFG